MAICKIQRLDQWLLEAIWDYCTGRHGFQKRFFTASYQFTVPPLGFLYLESRRGCVRPAAHLPFVSTYARATWSPLTQQDTSDLRFRRSCERGNRVASCGAELLYMANRFRARKFGLKDLWNLLLPHILFKNLRGKQAMNDWILWSAALANLNHILFGAPLPNAALRVSLRVNVFRQQPKASARQCDKILRQKREVLLWFCWILMQDRFAPKKSSGHTYFSLEMVNDPHLEYSRVNFPVTLIKLPMECRCFDRLDEDRPHENPWNS